jgi:hypothetical protein
MGRYQNDSGTFYDRHTAHKELGVTGKPQLATRCNGKTHRHGGDQENRHVGYGKVTRHHKEGRGDRKITQASCAEPQVLRAASYEPKPSEPRESERAVLLNVRREDQAEDSRNERKK